MRIHEEHGAIPTLAVRSAKEIDEPNPAVKRALVQRAEARCQGAALDYRPGTTMFGMRNDGMNKGTNV